jgi:WS/DGAT/MGAT family acyltransferase
MPAAPVDGGQSLLSSVLDVGVFWAGLPWRALRLGGTLVPAVGRLARVLRSPQGRQAPLPFRAPRTMLNQPLTPRRAVSFATVPLDDMLAVKRAFGVTMNDVALGLVAEALRRYLTARGNLPDRPLIAQIPVGVHRDGGESGGNFVAATGASLHTEIEDPVERLAAIHASMQGGKAIQASLGDDLVVDALGVLPPAALTAGLGLYRGLGLDAVHPPIFNAIVSNVTGPPVPLYTCGTRLLGIYTLGPLLAGCGVNVTLMSHQDRMDFGITVCPDVVDAPWELADVIGDALAELRKVAEA